MYFIELFVRYFKKDKFYEVLEAHEKSIERNPLEDIPVEDFIEDSLDCEHVFMPIDSTGETLACSKCGLVVKREDLKKKNIFAK